jgi:hypothetical protein
MNRRWQSAKAATATPIPELEKGIAPVFLHQSYQE